MCPATAPGTWEEAVGRLPVRRPRDGLSVLRGRHRPTFPVWRLEVSDRVRAGAVSVAAASLACRWLSRSVFLPPGHECDRPRAQPRVA